MANNIKDISGNKYGMLTVIKRQGSHITPSGSKSATWLCRCECGNEIIVTGKRLRSGNTKSCGCLIHKNKAIGLRTTVKHGKCYTRMYKIWKQMKRRCNSPTCHQYKRYGEKGISVCESWNSDFQSFYDWSIKNGYRDDLSIDRVDNNGNYEPNNCRWADAYTQARNKSNNHYITCDGKTKTMAEWIIETGISRKVIEGKLKKGYTPEQIFNRPNSLQTS